MPVQCTLLLVIVKLLAFSKASSAVEVFYSSKRLRVCPTGREHGSSGHGRRTTCHSTGRHPWSDYDSQSYCHASLPAGMFASFLCWLFNAPVSIQLSISRLCLPCIKKPGATEVKVLLIMKSYSFHTCMYLSGILYSTFIRTSQKCCA